MRMKAGEFASLIGAQKKKRSKFRANCVTVDGITFDSGLEAARWSRLLQLQSAKCIGELRRQVVFIIAPSVVINGRKKPAMKYTADFVYMQNGKQVVEDVKGFKTKDYIMRRHLMKSVHGIDILETN